jgi:hypothetical protein
MRSIPNISARYSPVELAASDFDHPEWSKAQPIAIDRRWSGETAPASQHSKVQILWSNDALTVRFVCRQETPPLMSSLPKVDQKTIGVWERDVCEIFIAPDSGQPNRYFEFEAAPNGEWVDLGIVVEGDRRETDWDFNSGMRTASRISGDTLTTIIRIPWSDDLPRPQKGDAWRVNLFRCTGTGNERYLAWQPTYTSEPYFHVPEVFGGLQFE